MGEMIEYVGGNDSDQAYLARPEGDGPFPAIVLVHEWWGLTDWVMENANRFASQGYVAMAVDLYDGKATDDPAVAHELMRALDDGEAIADMKAAVTYIEELPYVDKSKPLGAIGWCMGGKFSRLIAQASDKIGPTVICYGSLATEESQIDQLKDNAVLGIFGEEDRGIPAAKVKEFGELLKAKGTQVAIHIYPNAGHAFMRPGGEQYHAEPAKDAWSQIDTFFAKNLKGKAD